METYFRKNPTYTFILFWKFFLKVSKSRKQFLKSSIFQNLTQKIWRISALCTSGQESFKFLGLNFGKLMILKIAFEIYWPLELLIGPGGVMLLYFSLAYCKLRITFVQLYENRLVYWLHVQRTKLHFWYARIFWAMVMVLWVFL